MTRTGNWKLNKVVEPNIEYLVQQTYGKPVSSAAQYCTPAYSANHVARAIVADTDNDPSISTKTVKELVVAKGIYKSQPSTANSSAVRLELQRRFYANRTVDIAAMEGFANI